MDQRKPAGQGPLRVAVWHGAFSYGHSQIDSVVKYIQNQEEHHRHRSFLDEYLLFLRKFDVPYDERYLFKPLDE